VTDYERRFGLAVRCLSRGIRPGLAGISWHADSLGIPSLPLANGARKRLNWCDCRHLPALLPSLLDTRVVEVEVGIIMKNKQLKSKTNSGKISRRAVFKLGLVSGIAVPMAAMAQPPNRLRPQQGDQLVFEEGPHQGEAVRPELLELEQKPVSALERDPQTDVLRDGSRLNRVIITRIDTSKLSAEFQASVEEGMIDYSAVCTHNGCDVINWDRELMRMA